ACRHQCARYSAPNVPVAHCRTPHVCACPVRLAGPSAHSCPLLRVEQLQLATLLGITPDIDDQGLWPLLARQRPLWIDVGLSDLFTHRGGINWFGNNRHNRPGLRTTPRTPPRINLHLPTHQRYTAGIPCKSTFAAREAES